VPELGVPADDFPIGLGEDSDDGKIGLHLEGLVERGLGTHLDLRLSRQNPIKRGVAAMVPTLVKRKVV